MSSADALYADAGNDHLHGGTSNDYLNGGADGDTMYREDNDDVLDGGLGADYYEGGDGNDTFVFDTGWGNDIVGTFHDGDMEDAIMINAARSRIPRRSRRR